MVWDSWHSLQSTADIHAAPLVFLDRADPYFPSDMATHLAHTHPTKDWENITDAVQTLDLDNLHTLNDEGGKDVYLTSTVDLITLPPFLKGQKPDQKTLQTAGAISCVIIVVDKGSGIMDAFFMYFYTYNKGPAALGHEVGNHLGDWYVTQLPRQLRKLLTRLGSII